MVLRIHIFLAHILQNASWEMALKLIFILSKSPDQVREFSVSQSWLSSSEARSTTSFACLGKLEHRCKDRIVPLSNIQKKKLKVNIFVGERSVGRILWWKKTCAGFTRSCLCCWWSFLPSFSSWRMSVLIKPAFKAYQNIMKENLCSCDGISQIILSSLSFFLDRRAIS